MCKLCRCVYVQVVQMCVCASCADVCMCKLCRCRDERNSHGNGRIECEFVGNQSAPIASKLFKKIERVNHISEKVQKSGDATPARCWHETKGNEQEEQTRQTRSTEIWAYPHGHGQISRRVQVLTAYKSKTEKFSSHLAEQLCVGRMPDRTSWGHLLQNDW
jgi:hypothetical protein